MEFFLRSMPALSSHRGSRAYMSSTSIELNFIIRCRAVLCISCARRSQKPASAGRGAAELVSVVVVSTAVLTALANVLAGNASLASSSPSDPSKTQDGQSAVEEVSRHI